MKWLLAHFAGLFLVTLAVVVLIPVPASGYMSASMELGYSKSNNSFQDTAGTTHTSRSNDFLQRYLLDLRRDIYPTLSVGAGYILEKDLTTTRADDIDSRSTLIRASPSADLFYRNPYFNSTMNYNKMEATEHSSGNPSQTSIQDNFNASLSLARRERRPTLSLMYSQSHIYDRDHLLVDSVSEQYALSSRYQPVRQLEVRYSSTYNENKDKLHGVETTGLTNSARLDYSDALLRNRVRVYSTYAISASQSQTKSVGDGTGEVAEGLLPFAGLAGSGSLGTDSPPEVPTLDTMVSNPLLIDGATNAASGINIGFSTLVTEPRNMGLDLGTETELNSINVWVNQRLPEVMANSFSWDIYISSDISNLKQWTLLQTVSQAPFGVFDARFELRFSNVTTRFIKVVTRPLASPVPVPGVDVNNIFVTELQAFIFRPVQNIATTRTGLTSQRIELGMNANLAKVPNLNYDLAYTQSKSNLSDFSPSTLMNRLSLNHRLSSVFTTGATASREDSREIEGVNVSHIYSAFLTATPLNTLRHSLRVSRQTNEFQDKKSSSDFIYFNNSAAIYRGVSLLFAIGQAESLLDTGQRSRSTTITGGSTLVPYRTMTINLYYSDLRSKTTGTDSQDPGFGSTTRSSTASVSYTPVETLHLYASFATLRTIQDRGSAVSSRIQNYSLSWMPAFAGDLSISVSAVRLITSQDQGETDTVTPALRWQVTRHATLDAGYQLLTTKNIAIRSKTETIFTTLKVAL